jgi:small subunit ribosomal protein S4
MGDPRRITNKYQGPRHPWNKDRIEREKVLLETYGLVNKKDLWKIESKLKKFKDNAKRLIAQPGDQAAKELQQLFGRLHKLGLIGVDATADEILSLTTEKLLDRRLQTILLKKELARSPKQARQFITHGHVLVGGKKMTVPSYLVPLVEEHAIEFRTASSLYSPDHPERIIAKKVETGAGEKHAVKTQAGIDAEEAPVTGIDIVPESEKPIEERIEEDVGDALEIAEAVVEAEAETIAQDHAQAVKKAATPRKKKAKEAEA